MYRFGESSFGSPQPNNHVAQGSGLISDRSDNHRFVRAEVTFLRHSRCTQNPMPRWHGEIPPREARNRGRHRGLNRAWSAAIMMSGASPNPPGLMCGLKKFRFALPANSGTSLATYGFTEKAPQGKNQQTQTTQEAASQSSQEAHLAEVSLRRGRFSTSATPATRLRVAVRGLRVRHESLSLSTPSLALTPLLSAAGCRCRGCSA